MSVAPSDEFNVLLTTAAKDIDQLGHVSNLSYLSWIQHVAIAHSENIGYDHARYREMGVVFVVRRHEIDYLAPAYLGEEIQLCTWIAGWKAATCERRTRIVRCSDQRVLARGATTWALVATESGRPTRIPGELVAAFGTVTG